MNDPEASKLFVYGTLRQGDVRWQFLRPYVADTGWFDTANGVLYDTGRGYPAARFDEAGTILGHCYELISDSSRAALKALDEVEGAVEGLYERIRITTGSGHCAWAYQFGGGLNVQPIPSGDWFDRPPVP